VDLPLYVRHQLLRLMTRLPNQMQANNCSTTHSARGDQAQGRSAQGVWQPPGAAPVEAVRWYSLVIFRANGKTVDSFELVSHRAEIGAVHLSRRAATMQGDVIELDNNLEARWREGMK